MLMEENDISPIRSDFEQIKTSNILLYKTEQGETRIEVICNNETFWISQKRVADLSGVDVRTINYHPKEYN